MKKSYYCSGIFALLLSTCLTTSVQAESYFAQNSERDLSSLVQQSEALLSWTEVSKVYNQAIIKDGNINRVLERLISKGADPSLNKNARASSLRLASLISWRDGKLDKSVELAQRAANLVESVPNLLLLARVSDAFGQLHEAKVAYQHILELNPEQFIVDEVKLQLALISAMDNDVNSYLDFAKNKDKETKNSIAITLSLMQFPSEALSLYEPESDSVKKQAISHIRMAGWAIGANELDKAKEHAWIAAQNSNLRSDRLYALSLLVEAHRSDDSLDALVERFSTTKELSVEARELWTDLLHQMGRHDEALVLFRSSGGGTFTPSERIKLIGMHQAAENDEAIVLEYEALIQEEPNEVFWYIGLSEYYAVRGLEREAGTVWLDFIANAKGASVLLSGAEAMSNMGFDETAIRSAELSMAISTSQVAGLMFLFEHHLSRKNSNEAIKVLLRLDQYLPENSKERMLIADSYERLGMPDQALKVWESLSNKADIFGVDETMRLAWLYRSLGRDNDALRLWKSLRMGQISPAVQGIVEQQIIKLSAELGLLGELAFNLEEKLASGDVSKNESSFLARIYTRVGDKVSAIEIIDEYFTLAGESETSSLKEQAKVYMLMGDFANHAKVTQRLAQIDPINKSEYLRDIILSKLEGFGSGGLEVEDGLVELKDLLSDLREVDSESSGHQFEAGVLALAGLQEEALASFKQASAWSPDNGDIYLQIGSLLGSSKRSEEALGMFQALVGEAEKEELFVVAIDGILNTFGATSTLSSVNKRERYLLGWVQRQIYSRMLQSKEKFYHYQLLSNIVSETGNNLAVENILNNSLAVGASRRTNILRELIGMSTPDNDIENLVSGVKKDNNARQRYSQRVAALKEALPPSVYMNLAESFLNNNDPFGAEKSVNKAISESGQTNLRSVAAEMFEVAGYDYRAIEQYRRALVRNYGNLPLMVNIARLREKVGQDKGANQLFARALEFLLLSQPKTAVVGPKTIENDYYVYSEVVDNDKTQTQEYKEYYSSVLQGFITSWQFPPSVMHDRMDLFENRFNLELAEAIKLKSSNIEPLEKYSRLNHLAIFLRSVSFAVDDNERADRIDEKLIKHFFYDKNFIQEVLLSRIERGLDRSAVSIGKEIVVNDASLSTYVNDLLDQRLNGKGVRFEAHIEKAIELDDFDPVLNMAFSSGEDSKIFTALRAWASQGYYLEAFKWSSEHLDLNLHTSLSKQLIKYMREDKSFLSKVFINDVGFLSKIENLTGDKVLSNAEMILLIKGDASYLKRLSIPYLLDRFTQEEFLEYFEDLLREDVLEPMQLVSLFWFDISQKPWDKVHGDRLAELIIGVFGSTKDNSTEFKSGNAVMHRGDGLSSFAGMIEHVKTAKENYAWIKRVDDYWREQLNENPGQERVLDLLHFGKAEEAVDKFIDNALGKIIDKKDENELIGYVMNHRKHLLPKYAELLKSKIQRRESESGTSIHLTDLYYWVFFFDGNLHSPDRIEFLRQATVKHPLSPKYAGMMRFIMESDGLPWHPVSSLQALHRSDPDNIFYRSALFLALINSDRLTDAMEINGIGREDMLSEGYFNNLRSKAIKEGLDVVGQFGGHLFKPSVFDTGMGFNFVPYNPPKDLEEIPVKIAQAVAEGDEASIRNHLRSLWQSVMKYKWSTSLPREQFVVDRLSKYLEILNLDWPDTASNEHQGRKLFDVMADYDFSINMFESFIRGKRVSGTSGLNSLYFYLVKAYENQGLANSKFIELSQKLQDEAIEASQDEFVFWLSFADKQTGLVSSESIEILDDWFERRESLSAYVLSLMAGQYHKAGSQDKALALYEEISEQAVYMHFPSLQGRGKVEFLYSHENRMTGNALINKAVNSLNCEQKEVLLNGIFHRTNSFVGKDERLRKMADLFMLQNMSKVTTCLQSVSGFNIKTISSAKDSPINALYLTGLLAKQGQLSEAKKELRNTVRLYSELRSMSVMDRQINRNGENSREGKIGQVFAEVLGLSVDEIVEENPVALSDIYAANPSADDVKGWSWLTTIARELIEMLGEEQFNKKIVVDMLADISLRLHSGGKAAEVEKIVNQLSQLILKNNFDYEIIQVVVSLADNTNTQINIETSQSLLRNGMLDQQSIIKVINETRLKLGGAEALQLAEFAATYTRFDDLLVLLIEMSNVAGRPDQAKNWERERLTASKLKEQLKQIAATAQRVPIH